MLLALAGCEVTEQPADDSEPRKLDKEPILRGHVVDLSKSKIDLHELEEKGFHAAGMLPGNHEYVPSGVIFYLLPEDVQRLLDLDLKPIDFDAFPPGALPIDGDYATCDEDPPEGRYCAYLDASLTSERCGNETIAGRLAAFADLPPYAGDNYAVMVKPEALTPHGRPMYALRIGKNAEKAGVPQVVVFAGQHAREWITTDAAMALIDHYAGRYATDATVRAVLEHVVLTVVPVANPDGYELTHAGGRNWRPNVRSFDCPVDLNRNYPFGHANQPGARFLCGGGENSSYHGESERFSPAHPFGGESEHETLAGLELLSDAHGDFPTAALLNVHAYGQMVLYTDGLSEGFWPCGPDGNCSNADLGAQHVLGGTRRQPKFKDALHGEPYRHGQVFRNLYAVSGDLSTHAHMDLGIMSLSLELGRTTCAFGAERRHDILNEAPAEQLRALVDELLSKAPGLVDGSFYDTHPDLGGYALPHLHRRRAYEVDRAVAPGYPDPDFWPEPPPAEHPTLRVSARTYIGDIGVFPDNGDPGMPDLLDDVLDGVAYRSWRWRPTLDPYKFPGKLTVCAKEWNCTGLRIGEGTDGVDLCSDHFFHSVDGWAHQGRADDVWTPQDQCYWTLTGTGSGMLDGESNVWSTRHGAGLGHMRAAHLVFSYEQALGHPIDLTIKASATGSFDSCPSGDCRVVYQSRLTDGVNLGSKGMRTELVDLSDFDGGTVELRWELRDSSPFEGKVKIYDPVILGWAN